jgi:CO/xanthine dehydrogenase Mo-binding subunit
MAECPRCDEPLNFGATACRCGWKARAKREPRQEKPREIVHCAHETCDVPAICRIKTATGWANFCLPHYDRYHEAEALKGLAAKGLDQKPGETKAEHVARMRDWFSAHAKLKSFDDATKLEDEWAA